MYQYLIAAGIIAGFLFTAILAAAENGCVDVNERRLPVEFD